MAIDAFECNHEHILLYHFPLLRGSWILRNSEDMKSESQEETGGTRPTAGTV